MEMNNQKAIQSYLEATKTEIASDRYQYTRLNLKNWLKLMPPRPVLFVSTIKKHSLLWKIFINLVCFFWNFPILPILIIIETLKFASQKCLNRKIILPTKQAIILGICHLIPELLRGLPVEDRPQAWITVPWLRGQIFIPDGEQQIPLFSLVDWSDIFWATKMSWLGAIAVIRTSSNREDCLQTYTAPKWFLVWKVLEKIENTISDIWLANNIDRWAILVDRVQNNMKIVLIQHGIMPPIKYGLTYPYRLKNIYKFYSFNQDYYEYFDKYIFEVKCNPNYEILPPTLELCKVEMPKDKVYKVLIINSPFYIEKEIEIAVNLSKKYPQIHLLLKQHPLTSVYQDNFLVKLGVQYIYEKSLFPEVDVAISPDSTLGLQYETCGIQVIWHQSISIEETVQDVVDILHIT